MDDKNVWHRQQELRENNRGIRLGFIFTELDLAITFCRIALGTREQSRFERNIANAQSAYTAAKRFINRSLTAPERKRIKEQVVQLDELLEQLNCDPRNNLRETRAAASY
jgi:hypothetical protein